MKTRLTLAAVLLQVLVLAYMAGEREWILRTGRTVLLRTAPIDPNDPMRGDYARLDYEISHVPRRLLGGTLPQLFPATPDYRRRAERRVYAPLHMGEDGIAELTGLTDTKPTDTLFIRGFAKNGSGRQVHVRYGIEALFMQQGTALKLEEMRVRDRPGVPLDIEVALSRSGVAVLKNYRWEPLGITVTFERPPAPARPAGSAPDSAQRQQFITGLNVELKNYGPEDVAIVDLPDAGSFRLVTDERWQETHYRWVGESRSTSPAVEAGHIIVLKPGQIHRAKIDFLHPAWFVVNSTPTGNKTPIPLRAVTDVWSASFRLEYAPPSKAAVAHLPQASLIRHSPLRSRAFNPTAGLD